MTTTSCAHCRREGPAESFFWMAHANFCEACIRQFEEDGWAAKVPDNSRRYELTEKGAETLPDFETIAFCPRDGMPIYRRWVRDGKARAGDRPACPFCVGKESEADAGRV